ncbi:MAG: metal ABC transporter substrate-binding protein [Acidobacteriota bacterium]
MRMKTALSLTALMAMAAPAAALSQVKVVTTLQEYAAIAREVGGQRVKASAIAPAAEDAHFIKPKPSYALMLKDADLFVSTGLDLELWSPVLVNKSHNRKIVDGAVGYVSASHGINLLDKPVSLSRQAGDIHIYGNPHISTSPINVKITATNIATGLCKVDPEGCPTYKANLARFQDRISRRLYGDDLVDLLGAGTLDGLAAPGRLVPFLKEKGMLDRLGGWLKEGLPFRGKTIICYHKNWIYFTTLFGLTIRTYVEPKPGIPPTARHVADLIEMIPKEHIEVLLAANYFERRKPQLIADRTGIKAVIVPTTVGGEPGVVTYFDLVDLWVRRLREAFQGAAGEADAESSSGGRTARAIDGLGGATAGAFR